ncbi:Peptidase S1, PA clan [Phytophthora cactorum]|nr:Peptidase S1, PA clan [Phytophthora cactorum]
MKLVSAFVYVSSIAMGLSALATNAQGGSNYSNVSVSDFVPSNLSSDVIATSLKTGTTTVLQGTKTYVTSLRVDATHDNFAAAILISPTHLLTGGATIGSDIRYASIGSHYNNGTEDGEQIKVVAILSHPNISENAEYSYDYVVLQLEKPSSFKPIPLAAADGSDIKYGEIVTHLGWYTTTGEGPRTRTHELQRADVQLMSNEECSKVTSVDDTRVCSHPIGNQNSCIGGYGGPLIVERPEGDVLVGMISWGDDCRKPGYPSYYSRIPVGHDWIERWSPPPPAPPLSPETTTIGKYIARFRYEKPQPREARAAPNGATSGGPNPSLLAQSIASVYVGGGENEDLAANTEEKEVEEDKESVDSVESKLRQRLGLWSSESRQGISDNREELSPAKSPEFVQSWGSVDWGSVDLEEMEEEMRTQRRSLRGFVYCVETEAIEFRLSIDASVDRRDTGRRQLGMKPPLSPGFIEDSSKSVDYRSISSRGRIEEVESSICSADAKCASVDDGKEEENRSPVAEQEEKIAVRGGNVSSMEVSGEPSLHDELSSVDIAAKGLRSNSSLVASHSSQASEPRDDALMVPVNEIIGEVASAASPLLDIFTSNVVVEKQEEKTQSPCKTSEHDATDAVAEPPLLPQQAQASLASPNDNVSGRSQDSSSSDRREELIPTETTKTLDNLVSLVVHSWENDFFSTSESKEVDPTDDTREQVTESREEAIDDAEDKVTTKDACQEMVPTQNIYLLKEKSTQPDQDDEEKEDDEVPGEEDDQIVQMLLGRISLLEEALRQIDI